MRQNIQRSEESMNNMTTAISNVSNTIITNNNNSGNSMAPFWKDIDSILVGNTI